MQTITRFIFNICSEKLPESKTFYTKLFDFAVAYDSDWFINLVSEGKQVELGIIAVGHDVVPAGLTQLQSGGYLTLVVTSADAVYAAAQQAGYDVVQVPHDTAYGQRRLLLLDPNGLTVDVSSPIPDFQFSAN